MFEAGKVAVKKGVPTLAGDVTKYYRNKANNKLNKRKYKKGDFRNETNKQWDATDVAIQKKIVGWGLTSLIISNEEMKDIMKIVKSLKELGLMIKGVSETINNEVKEQRYY